MASPIDAVWTESVAALQAAVDPGAVLVFDVEPDRLTLPYVRFSGITDDPEILSKSGFRHPVRVVWEVITDPFDPNALTTKDVILAVVSTFESSVLDLAAYGFSVRLQYAESVSMDGTFRGDGGETLHEATITILFDIV